MIMVLREENAEKELMRLVYEVLPEEMCEKLIQGVIDDISNTGNVRDQLSFLLAVEMALLHSETITREDIEDPIARLVMANQSKEDYCECKLERIAQYEAHTAEPEVYHVEIRIPQCKRSHRSFC
jgi:hypothetical protein